VLLRKSTRMHPSIYSATHTATASPGLEWWKLGGAGALVVRHARSPRHGASRQRRRPHAGLLGTGSLLSAGAAAACCRRHGRLTSHAERPAARRLTRQAPAASTALLLVAARPAGASAGAACSIKETACHDGGGAALALLELRIGDPAAAHAHVPA
jgi:hypothetical protein